jgi:antimicrobial peptide system SdpB family protein
VRVTEWADGTAVYDWLTHPLFGINSALDPVMRPLLLHPWSVSMMTWSVIVLEPFLMMGLVATRPVRKALLVGGIAPHASIMVLQGLGSFSLTMFGALVLYLWPMDEPFHFSAFTDWVRSRTATVSRQSSTSTERATACAHDHVMVIR